MVKPDLLKALDQIVRVVRESWELEEPDDQVPSDDNDDQVPSDDNDDDQVSPQWWHWWPVVLMLEFTQYLSMVVDVNAKWNT